MDIKIQTILPIPANYCKFADILKKVSRKNIQEVAAPTTSRDYNKTLLRI